MADCKDVKPSLCGNSMVFMSGECPNDTLFVPYVPCGENALHTIDCGHEPPRPFDPCACELTITDYVGVYDGESHGVSISTKGCENAELYYSVDGGEAWESEAPVLADAGVISVMVKAVSAECDDVIASGEITIEPKPITVRADDLIVSIWDGISGQYTLTASVDGLIGSDAISYELSLPDEVDAPGEYTINVDGDVDQGNYIVAFTSGTLTVEGASWSISPTGINGIIMPTENTDPFCTNIVLPTTSKSDAIAAINTALGIEGIPSSALLNAILEVNMAKSSHKIIYPSSMPSADYLANHTPWQYIANYSGAITNMPDPENGATTLANISSRLRGWLALFNSHIDYPVVKGGDNLYYSQKDVYEDSNVLGAIYLDENNSGDFSDSYNVIFGHNSISGSMFGGLFGYSATSLFTNGVGALIATPATYELTPFAVIQCNAYDENIFYTPNQTAEGIIEYLDSDTHGRVEVERYDSSVAQSAEKVIALSTCVNDETLERFVVMFKAEEYQPE